MATLTYQPRLSGYDWLEAQYFGPQFPKPPTLIVIHRAMAGEGVAEYFHSPGDSRKVSAHFAWSIKPGGYIQCVSLHRMAWHVGGGKWENNLHLNHVSIGIELPGRFGTQIPRHVILATKDLLKRLIDGLPTLKTIIGHSDADPKNRKDPGKEFDWTICEGLGLESPHIQTMQSK